MSWLDLLIGRKVTANGADIIPRSKLDFSGFTQTDDPTNDRTILTAPGGGGGSGALALTDHNAFRALSSVADKTVITFKNPPGTYVYASDQGATRVDDDNSLLKLTAVLVGANGRAFNVNAPVLPTIAALRLATSGSYSNINVQACSTFGDGGGGIFDKDPTDTTSSDNIGTCVVAGAIRYKRRFSGPLHGEWFGLLGDTVAFADAAVNTGTPGVLTCVAPRFAATDVGKAFSVYSQNAPMAGTVATVATAVTGTVTTVLGSPDIVGAGTSFTTQLYPDQLIKIGADYAHVIYVTDNTHATVDFDGFASAGGQTMLRTGIDGAGTSFTSLAVGGHVVVNSVRYTVIAIADNTHMSVHPPPTAVVSGQVLYTTAYTSGLFTGFNSSTSMNVGSVTGVWRVSGSALQACFGTDNSAAWNALYTAAVATGKDIRMPVGRGSFSMFAAVTPLSTGGLVVRGGGAHSLSAAYNGEYHWLREDLYPNSTTFRFHRGDGFISDAVNAAHQQWSDVVIIGSGAGTALGSKLNGTNPHGGTGGSVFKNVFCGNWLYAHQLNNHFNSSWYDCNVTGCGTGIEGTRGADTLCNGLKILNLQGNSCTFVVNVTGMQASEISGTWQGQNLMCLRMHDLCSRITIRGVWFENNTRAGGAAGTGEHGNSWDIRLVSGTVGQIEFQACNSNDIYFLDPVLGSGTIDTVVDWTSQFSGISVRPRWSNWVTSPNYPTGKIDATVANGILALGHGTNGYGGLGPMCTPSATKFVTTSGNITPDFRDGELQVYALSGNANFLPPTVSGKPLAGMRYAKLKLIIIPQANGIAVTFDNVYGGTAARNPWSDAGSAISKDAMIEWTHNGGGLLLCSGYRPFTPTIQTYTVTNHTDRRTIDETGITLPQLANLVGTMLNDFKTFAGPVK